MNQQLKDYSERYDQILSETIKNVCKGTDHVSQSLSKIFEKSKKPTQDQLNKARVRKEIGNPPGKKNDPLGDQLVWEQFLSIVENYQDIWIISHDSDLVIIYNNEVYLNPYLYEELMMYIPDSKLFIYQDLPTAMKKYASEYQSVEGKMPNQDDIESAKKEIDSFTRQSECELYGHQPGGISYEGTKMVFRCNRCLKILAAFDNPDAID